MMNYQPQTPYSYNASYNGNNNMSPITTSSTSTNSHPYGANMMDHGSVYNQSNSFNEAVPKPHELTLPSMVDSSMAMDYSNASYLNPNHVNTIQPTNYFPVSANGSCRSSCDDSVCNDTNAQCASFYPNNDAMISSDKLNVLPNIHAQGMNHNHGYNANNNGYMVNHYYAPCTNYNDVRPAAAPGAAVYSNYSHYTPTNTQERNNNNNHVSWMPLMNANNNDTYYESAAQPNHHPFTPPNNMSLTHANNALALPSIDPVAVKPEPMANTNAFIKNSNGIYGSYKQKYAQHSPHLNVKQELYRHRRQMRYDTESQSRATMNIKVKIKGSNFEALVQRLTRYGDNTYCIECNKSFLQKCHLLRHIRECHLVKQAVHSCPFCPKTFHQKSNLDTHCMTHAKDRKYSHPFKCLVCAQDAYGKDKAFTRKSSLKRHCQAKHKQVNVECDWINNQQTPKWDHKLKTFVFNPSKNRVSVAKQQKK